MGRMGWLIVSGLVLVGLVTGLVVYNQSQRQAASRPECPDALFVFFYEDDRMWWAAKRLGEDPRVAKVFPETAKEVYDRVVTADPDLAPELSVDTTPALITIAISEGFNRDEVLADLKDSLLYRNVQDCSDPHVQPV